MGTQPKHATYHSSYKNIPKSPRWIPSTLQNSVVITYRIRTGSTACSLPPFPHTCLQPSACHYKSSQIQLHLTPPGTCTPARYCKMLHSVMGSCKPRRKRWHYFYCLQQCLQTPRGKPLLCATSSNPYCIAEGFPPEALNPGCQEQLLFTDNGSYQELLEP